MNIQVNTIDIICSIIIIAVNFAIFYFPKNKLYKKLIDPVRTFKQDIKISRYFLIIMCLLIVSYYLLSIYSYFSFDKDYEIPYLLTFIPLALLIYAIIFFITNKKTLKEVEKDQ
ncbi:MAG: hypothetical protein PHG98_06480 [Bacteroidales bacterium]|nr:hypothetical protein [Bacteroidales bacterium]